MARPFKKLPEKQIMRMVVRLRSRNNRLWSQLWSIALEDKRGKAIWRRIMANDREVNKWGSRI
jgi:hypothetical protein